MERAYGVPTRYREVVLTVSKSSTRFESGISNPKTVLDTVSTTVGTLDFSSQQHILRDNLAGHDPKTQHIHFNHHRS